MRDIRSHRRNLPGRSKSNSAESDALVSNQVTYIRK